MVNTQDVEDEVDLEKIDTEMRLEKIRQTAAKLSWDGFSVALRRNLMEKRFVFDADSRIDVLQAMSIMRRNLPVDERLDLNGKLKAMADSMECSIVSDGGRVTIRNPDIYLEFTMDDHQPKVSTCKAAYFDGTPVECPEIVKLVANDDYATLRSSIYGMLLLVPNMHNSNDKKACVKSLEAIEMWLSKSCGTATFEKVQTLPCGFIVPRDGLNPSRIYYNVEPSYIVSTGRKHLDTSVDFKNLPYCELSIVANDKDIELPIGHLGRDPWSEVRSMPACFCLRFSAPMIFSYSTWRKLEKLLARPSVVRQHVNIYRYTSNFDFKNSELIMRTNMPPHLSQHRYIVKADYLKDEHDVVIAELYLRDIRDLDKVMALIRMQQMHNSLWESLISMCMGRWKGGYTVKMEVHPYPNRFEVMFSETERLIFVRFELARDQKTWSAVVQGHDHISVNADIDRDVTDMLLRSRSIPCALTRVTSALACRGSPDPADPITDSSHVVSSLLDKVGDAWLPFIRPPPPITPYVYEVEEDPNPGGLLASFKEIEEAPTPILSRPEAMTRTNRLMSDNASYANAHADLEALLQLADDGKDDGSKASTPAAVGSRHESSPAPRTAGIQLSPLETARLKMANSVVAAAAVGMTSHSDIFDFSDDRSFGSGSSYPSSSPHGNPFFPSSSPLSASLRGGIVKRRAPRARKSANLGDRTPSTESMLGIPDSPSGTGMTGKKARGKAPVRRPRGSRKNSVPFSHLDLEGNRPILQRSHSDFNQSYVYGAGPSVGSGMTPTSEQSSFMDEESDDEQCDPPPPPKGLMIGFPQPPQTPLPPMSSFQVPSPMGMVSTHRSPSISSQPGPSFTDPAAVPNRVQAIRKSSSEMVQMVPPNNRPKPPSLPQRRAYNSDLYDTADSPPAAASPVPIISTSSPAATASPRGDSSNSGDGISFTANVSTPPSKPEGSKIIIKIKTPSRSSPSVDQQKAKSLQLSSKPEKHEKKKKDPKEKEKPKPPKEKSDDPSKRKRKADDGKDRERSEKRHKSSISSAPGDIPGSSNKRVLGHTESQASTFPFAMNSLKNFKIPKKEDVKDSLKDKDPVTPTTPAAPLQIPSSSLNSGPSSSTPSSSTKSILKKNSTSGLPPQLPSSSASSRHSTSHSGNGGSSSRERKPAPVTEHRRSAGMPPSAHLPAHVANIPLPKGPPAAHQGRSSNPAAGSWVRPPTVPSSAPPLPKSQSPDPNAMQIDDPNSPEDTLQIADD